MADSKLKVLRLREVKARIGLTTSQIYHMAREGTSPRQIKLSPGPCGAMGWLEHELNEWIEARASERGRA